ncbi:MULTISPECIES: methionyl-tRNA formyltransferase [Chromobacterium]|uniref:methionyl-tRNA formyltransferase n=1 Tax=Chromobacterium TaxID=535 RepID=UPI000D31E91F|nr:MULTISPECIES: formyltransferase family protein [Chromobacterium]PTU65268.1 formyl transferase [Chromobacterium sp. Panama]UJB31018.1 formyl transferase [Chromobacterium sp. Beijing]
MRFAITLSDRFKPVLDVFLHAGWQPLKLFCTPVDHRMHHHKESLAAAERLGVPVQLSRMRERDLLELAEQDCEVLLVASYNWRVPDWEPYLNYAVNFHPSPLPIGRGPYPMVKAILDGHRQWGCSCHQLTREMDAGDVLAQEQFALRPDETHESLDAKLQLALYRLAGRVAGDFASLWDQAQPQGENSSYWPLWRDEERVLDFSLPVEDVMRRVRAFGDFECLAAVNGVTVHVHRAQGWRESHAYPPGSLILSNALSLLVAAADGMVLISEWSLNPPGGVSGRLRG